MAERRAFTKKIIDSDAFLEMPTSAQALYFHLNMRADDDGFVNSPKRIARLVNATEDDLRLLLQKRFILSFDSGIIVIKHWWMHNTLRKDRYFPTQYQEELALLSLKENRSYTENQASISEHGNQLATNWQPTGNQRLPQYKEIENKEIEGKYLSISDEIDCSTDVQRVVTAWNAIDGLPKITRLDPDSNRGKMLGARIKAYGIDKVLGAIESIPRSSFLMGKTKKQFRLTFDWFVKPNNFPKVLEGNYLDENKAAYAQDSDPYRGARMLARKLRERLPSLPEYPEETLQKWASVMDELNSDGHDWDEISDVLSYSQKSVFWQRQICDAYALRKKYVNILADMDKG